MGTNYNVHRTKCRQNTGHFLHSYLSHAHFRVVVWTRTRWVVMCTKCHNHRTLPRHGSLPVVPPHLGHAHFWGHDIMRWTGLVINAEKRLLQLHHVPIDIRYSLQEYYGRKSIRHKTQGSSCPTFMSPVIMLMCLIFAMSFEIGFFASLHDYNFIVNIVCFLSIVLQMM